MNKTVLITGATGGMGRELAREFARHGYDLVLTATRRDKLERLAEELLARYSVKTYIFPLDLARPDAPRELYHAIRSRRIPLSVLVNNAGFGLGGAFHEKSPARQQEMIDLNISALTQLCRLFIPSMIRQGYGGIINMASLGSFVPGPSNAVYCATKAYVLSLSEALAEELADRNIQVTAVCPGATATNFAHRAGMERTVLFRFGVLHPRDVARTAYSAFVRGKRVAVAGLPAQVMVAAARFSPRALTARVSGWMQRPREQANDCHVVDFETLSRSNRSNRSKM